VRITPERKQVGQHWFDNIYNGLIHSSVLTAIIIERSMKQTSNERRWIRLGLVLVPARATAVSTRTQWSDSK
jgi:hypothetical protein